VSFLRHWSFSGVEGSPRRTWAELAAVAFASAVAVALIAWRVDLKTVGTAAFADPGWDRHLYREMARRDLLDFKLAPYCWRILVPLLAKLQPWSEQAGFLTVTGFALVATGPATYLLVRSAGGSRASAAAMVAAFYSLGWASRFPMSDFWVPDATSMLLTTVIMWLVISKRWAAAAVVMALGVLAKESVLFVAPLVLTWHLRDIRDWLAVRRTVLVMGPALVVLIALRLFIQPENGNPQYIATMPPEISRFPELFGDYSYATRLREIGLDDRWEHRSWRDINRYLFDPYGVPLLALVVVGAIADPKRVARVAPFIVLVYSQLLFATDTQRLLVLAFPVLAVLGAAGVSRAARWVGTPERNLAILMALFFAWTLMHANDVGAGALGPAPEVVAVIGGVSVVRRLSQRAHDRDRAADQKDGEDHTPEEGMVDALEEVVAGPLPDEHRGD
jgi:hypothetical protein